MHPGHGKPQSSLLLFGVPSHPQTLCQTPLTLLPLSGVSPGPFPTSSSLWPRPGVFVTPFASRNPPPSLCWCFLPPDPHSREYLNSFSDTFSDTWAARSSSMELQTGYSAFPPCCFTRPAWIKCCLWGWSLVPDLDFHADVFIWPMSKSCWFLQQNTSPHTHSCIKSEPEMLLCPVLITAAIAFLTLVAVICLPHSCWEASGKVISSRLCLWPCHWPCTLSLLPSSQSGQEKVSCSHLQHCSWLLLPSPPHFPFDYSWVPSSHLGPAKTLRSAAAKCWERNLGGFPALSRSSLEPNSPPSLFSRHRNVPVAFGSGWAGSELEVPYPISCLPGLWAPSVPKQAPVLVSLSSFYVLHFFVTLKNGVWVWIWGFRVLQNIQIINCSSVRLTL